MTFFTALSLLLFPVVQVIAGNVEGYDKSWRPTPGQLAIDLQPHLSSIASFLPTPGMSSDLDAPAIARTLRSRMTDPDIDDDQLGAGLVLINCLERPENFAQLNGYLSAAKRPEAVQTVANLQRWSEVLRNKNTRRDLRAALAPLQETLAFHGPDRAASAAIAAIFDGSALRGINDLSGAPTTVAADELKPLPRAAALQRYRPSDRPRRFKEVPSGQVSARGPPKRSYNEMSAQELGSLLAQDPIDPLGKDFRMMIGGLAATLQAAPGNLEEVGFRIFSARLKLAKKYNNPFADMMEPDWKTGHPTAKTYEDRWNGKGNQYSWSFGLRNKSRGLGIWEIFQKNLKPEYGRDTKIPLEQLTTLKARQPAPGSWKTWTFSYHGGRGRWEFPVFLSKEGNYYIRHANAAEMPGIREELARLWKGALSSSNAPADRLTYVAEFEWLWYRANPFGRAGASVGDVLSVLLQKRLESDGIRCRVREKYVHQDLDALSLSFDDYVRGRVNELYLPPVSR